MSDVPGPLPLLLFKGVEVANAARTLRYLGLGLAASASGSFEVATSYPCSLLYRLAGGSDPTVFVSPSSDPAPWYHSDYPESAEFLGMFITDIEGLDDSATGRSAQARLGGIEGAQLGPQRQLPRTINVKATLVAGSVRGNEYGLRWLTAALAAEDCDLCEKGTLEAWLHCPPDDGSADDEGHYFLYDVGLVAGPTPAGQPITDRSCDIRDVEFTLVAENSYLYRAPATCLNTEILGADIACGDPEAEDICTWLFGPAGDPHCCSLTAPSFGVLGVIVVIEAPSGIGGVRIDQYDVACPATDDNLVRTLEIERVPVGGTLLIDSSQEKIVLIDADGNFFDGSPYVLTNAGSTLDWIQIESCLGDGSACVCVRTSHPCSGGGDATVQIATQLRER